MLLLNHNVFCRLTPVLYWEVTIVRQLFQLAKRSERAMLFQLFNYQP